MPSSATPEEVKTALAHQGAVIIDIRREDEIQESGRFETDRKWLNASGTPEENAILEQNAEDWIPDKQGEKGPKKLREFLNSALLPSLITLMSPVVHFDESSNRAVLSIRTTCDESQGDLGGKGL